MDDNTVTVTPFSGEADICPRESFNPTLSVNVMNTSFAITPGNILRLSGVVWPPSPEVMSQMCQQGFDDALRFLQRNNKISCLRCVAIQSSFSVAAGQTELEHEDSELTHEDHEFDGCSDCERRRDYEAVNALPDPIVKAIQGTCDQLNKGIVNWFFNHRPVKVLSFMTMPYFLSFDLTVAVMSKLWRHVPWMTQELNTSISNLFGFTKSMIMRMESNRELYSAQFSCQMSVTEFDYASENAVQNVVLSQLVAGSQKGSRRPSRLERSNTFGGRRKILPDQNINKRRQANLQRKSYAGSEQTLAKTTRKTSVFVGPTCQPPERVLSKVNFDFTVDLASSPATSIRSLHDLDPESINPSPPDVIETLKSLTKEGSHSEKDISAVGLASRALNWDREHTRNPDRKLSAPGPGDDIDRILESASKQEALMSFYYMDEQNRVKMTEIFKMPDDANLNCEDLQAKW